MQSNRRECVKTELWKADYSKNQRGLQRAIIRKQGDSKRARVSETKKKRRRKIIQKEGSSENCDPTTDLGLATQEKLSDCWLIPPDRISSYSFMSSHLADTLTCWINRSRRAIMFCTWLRRKNTSPISLRWASTSGSSLDTASASVNEVKDKPLTNEAALANLGGGVWKGCLFRVLAFWCSS